MSSSMTPSDVRKILTEPLTQHSECLAFCNVCKCPLKPSDPKLIQTHVDGQKHINKLQFYQNLVNSWSSSLHITGIKSQINKEEFLNHFSKFGAIKSYHFARDSGGYAIIEYYSSNEAHSCLSTEHIISGYLLHVVQREGKVPHMSPFKIPSKIKLIDESILTTLEGHHEFDDQINTLMMNLINSNDENAFKLFLSQLQCDISKLVGGTLCEYGSHNLGLGFRTSDHDISLLTDCQQDPLELLEYIQAGLSNVGYNGFVIKCKKCPVLRLTADKNNSIICELTINNYLAVKNNLLINKYFDLASYFEGKSPSTFFKLCFIIKIWAQQHHVLGNSSAHINSYSLLIIIIFFMQKIFQLPSLQSIANPKAPDKVGGWDTNFASDFSLISKPLLQIRLSSLLVEFFKFICSFDFKEYGINIRTGINKNQSKVSLYQELSLLFPDRVIDFTQDPIVVQDPFELNHNITRNLSLGGLKQIIKRASETLKFIGYVEDEPSSKIQKTQFHFDLLHIIKPTFKNKEKFFIQCHLFRPQSSINTLYEIVKIIMNFFFNRFSPAVMLCGLRYTTSSNASDFESFKSELDGQIDKMGRKISSTVTIPSSSWRHSRRLRRLKDIDLAVEADKLHVQIDFIYNFFDRNVCVKFTQNDHNMQPTFLEFFGLFKKELKHLPNNVFYID